MKFFENDLKRDLAMTRRHRMWPRTNTARRIKKWRFKEGGHRQVRPGIKRQATVQIYLPDSNEYILITARDVLAMGYLIEHQHKRGYDHKNKWPKTWEFYKPND